MTETAPPTSSADVFVAGLHAFSAVVDRLAPDDWDRPSACEGWTAKDVLGHLGTSIAFGVSVLRGEQPTWPQADRPADLVAGDPATFWAGVAAEAEPAVDGADLTLVMDTPMGPRTVADRLAFPAIDLFVHAWDIGHPLGLEVEVPDDVIAFAHHYLDPFPDEMLRGTSGSFGPAAEVPADATASETFLAWTGRPPR